MILSLSMNVVLVGLLLWQRRHFKAHVEANAASRGVDSLCISYEELMSAEQWARNHRRAKHDKNGIRQIEIRATQTGIGQRIDCVCAECGESWDVSCYDNW